MAEGRKLFNIDTVPVCTLFRGAVMRGRREGGGREGVYYLILISLGSAGCAHRSVLYAIRIVGKRLNWNDYPPQSKR